MEYIFCDKIVIPAEHALFYSEKVVYIPPTYQISYYNELDGLKSNKITSIDEIYELTYELRR